MDTTTNDATIYLDERIRELRAHAQRRRQRCKLFSDTFNAWASIIGLCTHDATLTEIADRLRYLSYLRHVPRRRRDVYSQLARDIREGKWG